MSKKLLAALSPAYGAATGQGVFGEIGKMGAIGQLGKAAGLQDNEKDKDKDKALRQGAAGKAAGMKDGGKVKSKPKTKKGGRGDGIAQRGKTKGRFV